ncbi:hypothetical protein Tco_1097557 [Tanacetum coccineum]
MLDSLKNWNNRFFWVDERIFPTVVDWRTNAPKDGIPLADSYSAADVTMPDTHRSPFQKLPKTLLCFIGLSRNYYLGDDVYLTFPYDDDREIDLFSLIRNPNPSKVKTRVRPRAAHEVPLFTATSNHVIAMEDPTEASGSSGTPSTVEKSPLDFADEDLQLRNMSGLKNMEQEAEAMGSLVHKRRRKRGNDGAGANAPPKVLKKDHPFICHEQSTHGGKSLASMGIAAGSTFVTPMEAKSVGDPDPLSYAKPQPRPVQDIAQSSEIPTGNVATTKVQDPHSAGSTESGKSSSFPSMVRSPEGIYQPGWGVTNSYRLDTPKAWTW